MHINLYHVSMYTLPYFCHSYYYCTHTYILFYSFRESRYPTNKRVPDTDIQITLYIIVPRRMRSYGAFIIINAKQCRNGGRGGGA